MQKEFAFHVGHKEAAERITKFAKSITTKKDAQELLKDAGILNKNNKLNKNLR